MTAKERVLTIRVAEKVRRQPAVAAKIGIEIVRKGGSGKKDK
jgi:hypothetical protein